MQPILQSSAHEYEMFDHFLRYPWVLPIHRYRIPTHTSRMAVDAYIDALLIDESTTDQILELLLRTDIAEI